MIYDPDTQKIVDELLGNLKNSITNIGSNIANFGDAVEPNDNNISTIKINMEILEICVDTYNEILSKLY